VNVEVKGQMELWKEKIWRDVFDMWEAQMISLKQAEELWALLDVVSEETLILRLAQRGHKLKRAA
jgi:hypothetical protein